ncbi:MAG: copper resistance protein NlpE N-terminal domain-containing protein [Fibrobacter sp.]|nr:copper resistance protein NlpE N-terminal domain-containing protein [Fibrobacter sp.]
MKKLCLLVIAMGILFVGCSKEEPAPLPPLKPVELPKGTAGLYSGRMPCDNCKALMVRLTLGEDSSATAVKTLVTDSMKVDSLKGSYSVLNETLSVALSEGSVKWNFKLDATGNLVMLTSAGTVYEDADGVKIELIRIYTKPKVKVADTTSANPAPAASGEN